MFWGHDHPLYKCTMKAVVSRLANAATLVSEAIDAKYVKNRNAEVCVCRRSRGLFTRERCVSVPVTTAWWQISARASSRFALV